MDKKIAGLLGAAAAFTTITAAHAATPAQPNTPVAAASYRDLLDPVPNAVAALRDDDARLAETPTVDGLQVAQYHHHHHHHHSSYHHHHHHHHMIPRPLRRILRHHHHHHHHHHNQYHR